MRVLHVINSLSTGGAEKLIIDSVPVYQQKGVQTDVLILSNQNTAFRKQLESSSNGRIFSLTTGSIYNPFLVFRIIPFLKKYDIIHAHLFPTLYWVVIANWLSFSKAKIFYTEHNTYNRRRKHVVLSRGDKIIYSKLDFVGCISKGVLDNLIAFLGNNNSFKIIHNGVNLKAFKELKNENEYQFFPKETKILIQVSSFTSQKDQKTLIEALNFLPEDFKLLLIGDGPLRKEREIQVNNSKLNNRVKFLGVRNDVPKLLRISDIVILSSHFEGFGLAVVEGMAANRPVIASDVSGLKEIVENYGLLFDKGNPKDLANKILSLFTNKNYYKEVQEACYSRAKDFSIETMVENYITEYKKALK